jgi:Glycerol uptake facilitator and related permeases (Major Intrinsic Protein Family)
MKRQKYFAEFIGTMVLVLMGCGAAIFNGGCGTAAQVLTVAFAFGLAVMAMCYAIGNISGCHINPAITIGFCVSSRMKWGEGLLYMLSQVLGVTDSKKGTGYVGGLAIGLTLTLIHIVCIPITGTSVNPARSIGPAIFEGGEALSQLWIFIVAPLLGGCLAALIWKLVGEECKCCKAEN